MNELKKFINIHDNILIEWIYNNGNVSENYSIWSDLRNQTKNFLSKSNNNNINYTLFNIDPVLKKYTKLNISNFNFLKIQDYFTSLIQYDKINIHLPFNYDFENYIGFLLKIYVYDFENKKIIHFSNYFYDKTDFNVEKLIQINKPFKYNEKEWGKCLSIQIPSIDEVSNDRIITSTSNIPKPNSINENLTNKIGVNLTNPIFIDFSFITSRETILGTTYYYLGDTITTSIPKKPEYQSLGVSIKESKEWDFFEIYGFYNDSNENLDNFIKDLENKGRKINVEYIITLYEENIQSGFPLKFIVTENFSQKIEFRPIFKYSNTTAAIDVEMQIKDLVDNSIIIRNTSMGLTKNLFKYGKKLSRLNIDTINKPKIYNYRSDNSIKSNTNLTTITNYGITKVPYPLLISNYKILLNNSNNQTNNNEYKSLGTLTLLLNPFDNIVKFKIARQLNEDGSPESYNMSEILNNAKLTLIFKSDNEIVEKNIFYETNENNIELGVVVFKINESDIKIIKKIKEKDDNFYLTVVSNQTRTLLYSGKFKIYEDIKFLDNETNSYLLPNNEPPTNENKIPIYTTKRPGIASNVNVNKSANNKFYIDEKIENNNIFKEKNLPIRPDYDQSDLDYYRNLIIYLKQGSTSKEIEYVKSKLESLGLSIYYNYSETFVLERVHVNKIKNVENINYVNNVIQLKLNLGWGNIIPPTKPSVNIS